MYGEYGKVQPAVTGRCVASLRDRVCPMSVWHTDMCVCVSGVVPSSPHQIHSPAH